MGGGRLTISDILGIYLATKYVLRYIERQAMLYGLFCRRAQETKKLKACLKAV